MLYSVCPLLRVAVNAVCMRLYISFLTALCDELALIVNGRIEYLPDTTAPYDVSTVAIYICDEGYALMGGSPMRNCIGLSNGGAIFNGTAPTCERKWTS